MGYELVDVELAGRGLVRVYIDLPPAAATDTAPPATDAEAPARPLPPSVKVEDCERVSHQLSHVLTVENIDYARLEVSSPGVDRPLKRASDYVRFEGEQITVRLREAFGGRKNFEGVLVREDGAPGEAPRWALELPDPKAAPKKGKGGAKSVASKQKAKAKVTEAAPATSEPEVETVRRLSFTLDEVERARLVPKLKF
jgi:ribosome maturation factor RimP